jgi:hypothetical protein
MSDDDRVYPPVNGKVQRIAVSAASLSTAIDAKLSGQGWLRLTAIGVDVDYLFGTASEPALVKNQLGVGNGVGPTLAAGQSQDFYDPGTVYTNIVAIASGAGFLILARVGRDRTKNY